MKINLKTKIFIKMTVDHKGKENAIKRLGLLRELNNMRYFYDPPISDREMRAEYEDLPMCGNVNGLYFPATVKEIQEQIDLNIKKIRAYNRKNKILKKYKMGSEPEQLRLEL